MTLRYGQIMEHSSPARAAPGADWRADISPLMVATFLLAAGFAVMVPMLTGMSTWQAILYLLAVPFLYQALMILDLLMGWGFVGEDIHRPEVSRWRCAACWSQGMEEVAVAVSMACIVGAVRMVVGGAWPGWL